MEENKGKSSLERIKRIESLVIIKSTVRKREGTHETIHGAIQQHGAEESTIYREEYCLSPSRHKFVSLFWWEKLELIAVSLSEFNVQISRENDLDDLICATGSAEGLDLLMKELQKLGEQVLCHIIKEKDPRIVRFVAKEDICKTIDPIELNNQCVLGFCEELNVLQVKKSNRCQNAGEKYCLGHMEILNSARLSDDAALFLVNGDARHAVVDIIVHETTEKRKSYTLPTKYIADGEILAGNVTVMAPDHCFCKYVIRASSSIYLDGTRGEAQCLIETVTKCLETADSHNCNSIAFPAFGIRSSYPVAECTRLVVEAVKTYVKSRNQGTIKELYLCADTPDIIQHFSTSIQNNFPQASSALPFPIQRTNDITMRAPSTKKNRQTINITICQGDIAKQETDVIVNSTSCELNLRSGAVSAAILAQSGTNLQAECRKKYPNGIRKGEIARTSGHDLSCKEVFHVAIDDFKSACAEENLRKIVLQCLEEASKSQYTSIAFPALGSGVLGYPRNIVSSTMIKAFNHFRIASTSTSISDIKVVIWNDLQTIKEFQENMKSGMQIAERSPSLSREHDDAALRSFSSHELSTSGKDSKPLTKSTGYFECKIDGLRLLVKQGDITEEAVDAVVNSSNDAFDLNIGSVSRALMSKSGDHLVMECKKRVTDMQAKGVCVTKAFNMNCRYILHVSSNKFHTNWQAGIKAILKEIEGLGINTIAFPALGTGGYNVTSEMLAEAMFQALVKFYKSHTDTELEVRVVLFDSGMIPPFVSQIQAQVVRAKDDATKLWKRKFFKGKSDVPSLSKLITTNNSVQEALRVSAEDSASVTKMLDGAKALAVPFAEERTALPEIKSTLPTFWADQGRDKKLKRCSLSKSDKEFKTVEKNFRASLGQAKINIVTIERIQNPVLYMHYMIKKKEMESQNADIPGIPNEKTLWHGTDFAAVSSINHHGFNRSYCGKNATAYGEGVYFAVSSEYSASPKYSPPDSKGRRYIYQCNVLTGQAMIGKAGLKVLPQRTGDILYDSATNDLKQPTMYVIFNDYQAYPEYLITFKN